MENPGTVSSVTAPGPEPKFRTYSPSHTKGEEMSRYHSIHMLVLSVVIFLTPYSGNAKIGACAPRAEAVAHMEKNHGSLKSRAVDTFGFIIELWTVENGKRWAILYTKPSGATCVLSEGVNWVDSDASPAVGQEL